ncbi:hypothetical protein LEP1GSC172_3730 [Leptospira noguchii]|uniref:Uncharacterized protein n=1 Tax=Leptospira noguchii TaxID=28182 RepID=M6VXL5_9LEPT|nr:hypothetical protein LEP1GSC172_3730 [Leptospira noguchii]
MRRTSAIPKDVACVLDSGFKRIEKTSKKVNIIKPKNKLTAAQKTKNTRMSKKAFSTKMLLLVLKV